MKVNRHAKIIELIGKYHIETQEELADYLNREGFKVTQATVSRDIRDLKLTKIPAENGKQKYALHQESGNGMSEKYIRVLRDGYMSMDMAQNILVIKTVAGMAMAVCLERGRGKYCRRRHNYVCNPHDRGYSEGDG